MADKLPEYLDQLFGIYSNMDKHESAYRLFLQDSCETPKVPTPPNFGKTVSEPREKAVIASATSTTADSCMDFSNSEKNKGEKLDLLEKDDFTLTPYKGFDPKNFLMVLEKKATAQSVPLETHKKNILRMAFITTMRGNNLKKIAEDDFEEFFDSMTKIYGLKEGKPSSSKDVTLPRIAMVSAAEIALAIKKGIISTTIVDPEQIHKNFPRCMCFSDFGFLIPQKRVKAFDDLFLAYCFHQYLFSSKINTTKKPNKETILRYAKIQRNSNFYTHDEKISFLNNLNLIRDNKINPEYFSAILFAVSLFQKLK